MGPVYDVAAQRHTERLEYTVNDLASKLGICAPMRLPNYSDEDWLGVLEEVTPGLERQWSSAARFKAERMLAPPGNAYGTPIADAAAQRLTFRLEYTVNDLADKLGVPAPQRLPNYSDEDWIGVLEEVTPYLERQWSSAARRKAEEQLMSPEDALEPTQRDELRERYVQRLEARVASLSQREVAGVVSRVPASFALRATDQAYIEELEEVVSLLAGGKFRPATSAVW